MAVTREGIPLRVWSWPGNSADAALIRQVKEELRSWTLGRVVWVADRGFACAENRRVLRRGADHYILAEKLRGGSAEAKAALSRAGRYRQLAGNLRIKEVRISAEERFVVAHNPEAAERDATVRARLLARLEQMISGSDALRLPCSATQAELPADNLAITAVDDGGQVAPAVLAAMEQMESISRLTSMDWMGPSRLQPLSRAMQPSPPERLSSWSGESAHMGCSALTCPR